MDYRCPKCDSPRQASFCPDCGVRTQPLEVPDPPEDATPVAAGDILLQREATDSASQEPTVAVPPPPPPPPGSGPAYDEMPEEAWQEADAAWLKTAPVGRHEAEPPTAADTVPAAAVDGTAEPAATETAGGEPPPDPSPDTVTAETLPAETPPADTVTAETIPARTDPPKAIPASTTPATGDAPPQARSNTALAPSADILPYLPPIDAPREQPSEPAAQSRGPAAEDILLKGQLEVEQDIRDGYAIYLVAGIGGSGKTQLLEAFERLHPGNLSEFEKGPDGRVARTTPDTLTTRRVQAAGRKLAFLDAPGEIFAELLPRRGKLSIKALEVLRLIAESFRGLVLVIDLEKLWSEPQTGRAEWKEQVEIAAWILAVLRWLRLDGVEPEEGSATPLHRHIDKRVRTMKRRIRQPVQVLYTKADEVQQLPIPGFGRKVYPAGEDPFFFSLHCLQDLHAALLNHADHFRYDFVHSIVTAPDTGVITRDPPCGVDLSFQWLLDPEWRYGGVPTRAWIRLQRALDRLTGRAGRWRQLADPRRLS